MEKWARMYGSQAQFLMVCVESAGVAVNFGRMFDLKSVVNSYIPSRGYMPVGFGQLGCSGFVVSTDDGCFVSRKTQAYLQYGEEAFTFVEKLLLKVFAIKPLPRDKPKRKRGGEEKKEDDFLNPNWVLPSVGNESMDKEHEDCEEALSNFVSQPSVQSLTKVMELLTAHFQHEELLMKSFGFGRPGEDFSPYSNHVKDHERILDIGFVALAKLSQIADNPETQATEPNKSVLPMAACSQAQGTNGSV